MSGIWRTEIHDQVLARLVHFSWELWGRICSLPLISLITIQIKLSLSQQMVWLSKSFGKVYTFYIQPKVSGSARQDKTGQSLLRRKTVWCQLLFPSVGSTAHSKYQLLVCSRFLVVAVMIICFILYIWENVWEMKPMGQETVNLNYKLISNV